jgi:hypothetical protein
LVLGAEQKLEQEEVKKLYHYSSLPNLLLCENLGVAGPSYKTSVLLMDADKNETNNEELCAVSGRLEIQVVPQGRKF